MLRRCRETLIGIFLALGMVILVLATTRAAGEGGPEWRTDTLSDFSQGTMDGVDVWSSPGTARLDHPWWSNVRVNDDPSLDKLYPRLSFVLTDTTQTHFLIVWADERDCDHCPDIYFARSTDGGKSWSPNVMVQDPCDPNDPPYPDCPCLTAPDITVRLADESFWVVWQHDPSYDNIGPDDGDIYYATSDDGGTSWSAAAPVCEDSGMQILPRIVSHGPSGYLYTIWEDERDDDGDIYISRYNPDADTAWSAPIKISDDTFGKEQAKPALAVDADGNVYAVWEDRRNDPEGHDSEVYFSRWRSDTAWNAGNWSANTRLSDPAMDFAEDPTILAGPGGALFAAWMERVPTGESTYDFQIVVARSDDGGDTWNRSVVHRLPEASEVLAFYANPTIGVDPLGRVYLAWLYSPDSQVNTASILFSVSPDGGRHWTVPRVLNQPSNEVSADAAPTLALGFGGKVVVAWMDYREGASTQIYATGYPTGCYLNAGEYRREFDAGEMVSWGTISWTASITPGTGLVLATRVMVSPGAGWTDWFTHAASGDALPHPPGRFIQYRALFSSDGNGTPVLDRVIISYKPQRHVFLPLVFRGD